MSNDFFAQVDGTIASMKSAKAVQAEKQARKQAFFRQATQKMRALSNYYAEQLSARGITARVAGDSQTVRFEMRWADKASHGFTVRADIGSGRLKLIRSSTSHMFDGRLFQPIDPISFDERTWSASRFEDTLRATINDYLRHAPRHGGVA